MIRSAAYYTPVVIQNILIVSRIDVVARVMKTDFRSITFSHSFAYLESSSVCTSMVMRVLPSFSVLMKFTQLHGLERGDVGMGRNILRCED